jgi:hypothetical protein
MFREAYRSSSGALTVFVASGLHTHVVTGRSQVLSSHSDLTTAGHHINSVTRLHLVGCFYRIIPLKSDRITVTLHEDLLVKVPTLIFYTHVTANRTVERPNQVSSRSPGL